MFAVILHKRGVYVVKFCGKCPKMPAPSKHSRKNRIFKIVKIDFLKS